MTAVIDRSFACGGDQLGIVDHVPEVGDGPEVGEDLVGDDELDPDTGSIGSTGELTATRERDGVREERGHGHPHGDHPRPHPPSRLVPSPPSCSMICAPASAHSSIELTRDSGVLAP